MSDAFRQIDETVIGDLAVFVAVDGRLGFGVHGGNKFAKLTVAQVRQLRDLLNHALTDNGSTSHE